MSRFRVNELVTFAESGVTARVLWIDRSSGGYFLIDIAGRTALPEFRVGDDMDRLIADGLLRKNGEDPWLFPLSEESIPDGHKRKRDEAWVLIQPLVIQQPEIFMAEPRWRAVEAVVLANRASRHKVYRLLRRYWQRGMSPNAVLPDYDRCGGRGKAKAVSSAKRGRPAQSGIRGVNVDEKTRTMFRDAVTRYFAVNRQMSLDGCYTEMLEMFFTDYHVDEKTGRQIGTLRTKHPSLRQFQYWFAKDNDIFQIERKRRTPRVYDKDMRAVLGTSTGEVFGPGSRYQIDATIADVYLVSRFDRKRIIGRPVLYVVIDVFSRMVVGIYVGLEGPSWVGAMMAIANAASDKVAFCKPLGVDLGEADWPCQNLPAALLGDRGEMLSVSVETLIEHFHVRIENTAPYRADWKGVVEQRFRLIPAKFQAYVPGFVAPDFRERGVRDYALDGKMNIDEFTKIVVHILLFYNNEHRVNAYERNQEMIADDVTPIPIELWEWGVAKRMGLLRSFPEDQVRLSLLPSDEATVTEHGIRFYSNYYTCQEAMAEHWFERARQKGKWKVRVSYEPRLMDEIYLHQKGGRTRFVPCAMTDRTADFRGKTLWEIDQIRQEERQERNADQPRERQAQINLNRRVKSVVAIAESDVRDANASQPSDRQRKKDMRKNRQAERREIQGREAFGADKGLPKPAEGGKVIPFAPAKPVNEDYELPSIADLPLAGGADGDDHDA